MNNAEVVTLLMSIRACESAIQWVIEHGGDADALLRDASEDHLAFIIYHAPDEYKARAWEALLARDSVSELVLRAIICSAPDEYRARARAVLNERGLK